MDVLAVRALMRNVVDQVRAGQGPYFIEAMTYRFMGHSMADPSHGHYRSKDEVEEHRKRDPLVVLKEAILGQALGSEADFKRLEGEVAEIVAAAVHVADTSPFPDHAALFTDVLAVE